MTAKMNQNIKREKKKEKRAKIDRVTNWFMINLSWGILAIIVLFGLKDPIMGDPRIMITPSIVFAVASVALFVCGGFNLFRNRSRTINYGIFTAIVALVSIYLAYYGPVRSFVLDVLPISALESAPSMWWTTWGPALLTAVYLVGAFVWTAISVAKIEKTK